VTTALLGNAIVPAAAFENTDGTPVSMNTDCLAVPRNVTNPFPGPFETVQAGSNAWKVFNDTSVSAPSGLSAVAVFGKATLSWSEFMARLLTR
jgi:hypothetical protein